MICIDYTNFYPEGHPGGWQKMGYLFTVIFLKWRWTSTVHLWHAAPLPERFNADEVLLFRPCSTGWRVTGFNQTCPAALAAGLRIGIRRLY
ncbi:MAG TPA: hypothetical protein VGJ97_06955 [Anaerolineaceae bacterium]